VSPAVRPVRLPRAARLALPRFPARLPALLLGLLLAGCSAAGPGPERAMSYAYPVPPDVTFDLHRGQALGPAQMDAELARVRLLFLGEHHSEARSHAFQRELIARLAAGRPVQVALEMFPPEADPALDEWRQGKLDELTFLERSRWYERWGFPWAHYKALFELIRERHLPLFGVNATREEREAVHADKPAELPADVRALLGDLDAEVPPHAAYLLDTLREVGHGGDLQPGSDTFRRFYRVQRMWDRLLGVRSARLAERQGPDGITVVLLGSGHLAFGLGANLQAARESPLPRLSVWDALVEPRELDAQGRYPVPVGMADWVRVYVSAPGAAAEGAEFPSLAALSLEAAPEGMRVKAVHAFGPSPLKALQPGDVILALQGAAPRSPAALRLAYERLPFGKPAHVTVLRGDKRIEVDVTPQRTAGM
jgi:uncharacterized iron-regulated protein